MLCCLTFVANVVSSRKHGAGSHVREDACVIERVNGGATLKSIHFLYRLGDVLYHLFDLARFYVRYFRLNVVFPFRASYFLLVSMRGGRGPRRGANDCSGHGSGSGCRGGVSGFWYVHDGVLHQGRGSGYPFNVFRSFWSMGVFYSIRGYVEVATTFFFRFHLYFLGKEVIGVLRVLWGEGCVVTLSRFRLVTIRRFESVVVRCVRAIISIVDFTIGV